MMKTLSLAAIAVSAFTAVSANAHAAVIDHVDLYGVIAASVDGVDNGDDPSASIRGSRNLKLSSNASRIGFKGREDLGGGLGAVWQIESLIYIDGSARSTFATRNSFIGLESAAGSLLVGRFDTPYKRATRSLDAFGLQLADNRSLLGGVSGRSAKKAFDGREKNILVYHSPERHGCSFEAAYVTGAEDTSLSTQDRGDIWSLAGRVRLDHWTIDIAAERHRFGDPGTGTLAGAASGEFAAGGSRETAWKAGLDYRWEAIEVAAVYEKTHDDLGGAGAPPPVSGCTGVGQDCYGHQVYYLAGRYRLGADALKLAWGHAGNLAGGAGDSGAWQLSLGYDHPIGERTEVLALYTRLANGRDIDYGLTTTTVTSGATAAAGNGATLSGVSIGLRHVF